MSPTDDYPGPFGPVSRRAAIGSTLLAGAAFLAPGGLAAQQPPAPAASPRRKPYAMKKSINLWAFPYPQRMTLVQCLRAGKGRRLRRHRAELRPGVATSPPRRAPGSSRTSAAPRTEIGIAISGLCSFLFWPYPLTSNDEARRRRALELATRMAHAAHDLGTDNLLVVPGAVHIPWRDDHEPVRNDVCDRRAREAVATLLKTAETVKVHLNIENIFFNGYLMTPMEMNAFVDGFSSPYVRVHFDTGNIMLFQHPEHWVQILGTRIGNIHFKEFTKKGTDHSLESFRPLLDGTTNWPAVMAALDETGYTGYCTFEYFHPYAHYPEALIYQTSDSLDRILGRK